MPEIRRSRLLAPILFATVLGELNPSLMTHIQGNVNCRVPGFDPTKPHMVGHFHFDHRAEGFITEIRGTGFAKGKGALDRTSQILTGRPPEVVNFDFGGRIGNRTIEPWRQFEIIALPLISNGDLYVHHASLHLVTPSSPAGTVSRLTLTSERTVSLANLALDPNTSQTDRASLEAWFQQAQIRC